MSSNQVRRPATASTDAETKPGAEAGTPPAAADAPIEDGRREYKVTKLAGPRVAGVRHEGVGKPIRLTEAEASDELLSGTIVPAGEELHAMFTDKATKPAG